jgi:hypothetical protein
LNIVRPASQSTYRVRADRASARYDHRQLASCVEQVVSYRQGKAGLPVISPTHTQRHASCQGEQMMLLQRKLDEVVAELGTISLQRDAVSRAVDIPP